MKLDPLGNLAELIWKLFSSIEQPDAIYSHSVIPTVTEKAESLLGSTKLSGKEIVKNFTLASKQQRYFYSKANFTLHHYFTAVLLFSFFKLFPGPPLNTRALLLVLNIFF